MAKTECTFIKPLFFPGEMEIKSIISEIRTTSFSVKHFILNSDSELVAELKDIIVVYDYTQEKKVDIPQEIRTSMQVFVK